MQENETTKTLSPFQMIDTYKTYVCQIIEEEFKPSARSGNMMIERELQILSPETIVLDGQEYTVSGMKCKQFLVTKNSDGKGSWDMIKTKASMGRVFEDYKKLKLDVSQGIDENNPALGAKGKIVDTIWKNETYPMTEPLTTEEAAAGQKVGKAKLDGEGKPMIGYKKVMAYIQGVHEGNVGAV